MKRKFKVLYTHQKTKKRKVWQDGFLTLSVDEKRGFLSSEEKRDLSAVYLEKKQVEPGLDLESDKFLIQVEEELSQACSSSEVTPSSQSASQPVVSTPQEKAHQRSDSLHPSSSQPVRKKFNIPRRVAPKVNDIGSNDHDKIDPQSHAEVELEQPSIWNEISSSAHLSTPALPSVRHANDGTLRGTQDILNLLDGHDFTENTRSMEMSYKGQDNRSQLERATVGASDARTDFTSAKQCLTPPAPERESSEDASLRIEPSPGADRNQIDATATVLSATLAQTPADESDESESEYCAGEQRSALDVAGRGDNDPVLVAGQARDRLSVDSFEFPSSGSVARDVEDCLESLLSSVVGMADSRESMDVQNTEDDFASGNVLPPSSGSPMADLVVHKDLHESSDVVFKSLADQSRHLCPAKEINGRWLPGQRDEVSAVSHVVHPALQLLADAAELSGKIASDVNIDSYAGVSSCCREPSVRCENDVVESLPEMSTTIVSKLPFMIDSFPRGSGPSNDDGLSSKFMFDLVNLDFLYDFPDAKQDGRCFEIGDCDNLASLTEKSDHCNVTDEHVDLRRLKASSDPNVLQNDLVKPDHDATDAGESGQSVMDAVMKSDSQDSGTCLPDFDLGILSPVPPILGVAHTRSPSMSKCEVSGDPGQKRDASMQMLKKFPVGVDAKPLPRNDGSVESETGDDVSNRDRCENDKFDESCRNLAVEPASCIEGATRSDDGLESKSSSLFDFQAPSDAARDGVPKNDCCFMTSYGKPGQHADASCALSFGLKDQAEVPCCSYTTVSFTDLRPSFASGNRAAVSCSANVDAGKDRFLTEASMADGLARHAGAMASDAYRTKAEVVTSESSRLFVVTSDRSKFERERASDCDAQLASSCSDSLLESDSSARVSSKPDQVLLTGVGCSVSCKAEENHSDREKDSCVDLNNRPTESTPRSGSVATTSHQPAAWKESCDDAISYSPLSDSQFSSLSVDNLLSSVELPSRQCRVPDKSTSLRLIGRPSDDRKVPSPFEVFTGDEEELLFQACDVTLKESCRLLSSDSGLWANQSPPPASKKSLEGARAAADGVEKMLVFGNARLSENTVRKSVAVTKDEHSVEFAGGSIWLSHLDELPSHCKSVGNSSNSNSKSHVFGKKEARANDLDWLQTKTDRNTSSSACAWSRPFDRSTHNGEQAKHVGEQSASMGNGSNASRSISSNTGGLPVSRNDDRTPSAPSFAPEAARTFQSQVVNSGKPPPGPPPRVRHIFGKSTSAPIHSFGFSQQLSFESTSKLPSKRNATPQKRMSREACENRAPFQAERSVTDRRDYGASNSFAANIPLKTTSSNTFVSSFPRQKYSAAKSSDVRDFHFAANNFSCGFPSLARTSDCASSHGFPAAVQGEENRPCSSRGYGRDHSSQLSGADDAAKVTSVAGKLARACSQQTPGDRSRGNDAKQHISREITRPTSCQQGPQCKSVASIPTKIDPKRSQKINAGKTKPEQKSTALSNLMPKIFVMDKTQVKSLHPDAALKKLKSKIAGHETSALNAMGTVSEVASSMKSASQFSVRATVTAPNMSKYSCSQSTAVSSDHPLSFLKSSQLSSRLVRKQEGSSSFDVSSQRYSRAFDTEMPSKRNDLVANDQPAYVWNGPSDVIPEGLINPLRFGSTSSLEPPPARDSNPRAADTWDFGAASSFGSSKCAATPALFEFFSTRRSDDVSENPFSRSQGGSALFSRAPTTTRVSSSKTRSVSNSGSVPLSEWLEPRSNLQTYDPIMARSNLTGFENIDFDDLPDNRLGGSPIVKPTPFAAFGDLNLLNENLTRKFSLTQRDDFSQDLPFLSSTADCRRVPVAYGAANDPLVPAPAVFSDAQFFDLPLRDVNVDEPEPSSSKWRRFTEEDRRVPSRQLLRKQWVDAVVKRERESPGLWGSPRHVLSPPLLTHSSRKRQLLGGPTNDVNLTQTPGFSVARRERRDPRSDLLSGSSFGLSFGGNGSSFGGNSWTTYND